MKKILILLILAPVLAFSQTPCENGKAGNYDCLGIDLQSHVSVIDLGAEELDGLWVNDIWGWVDPETDREYALVGMTNGTSFVDITDPVNPVVLGVLLEHNAGTSGDSPLHDGAKSIWRDIKVYQNHAYIVSEDENHGIQVFDLTQLRNVANPSNTNFFEESGHYDGIGQSHNIHINESTGFLYAVGFQQSGFTCNGGGLHVVDLSDPVNPTYAGCFDNEGYVHDTQCVIYNGPDADYVGQELCFNSNGNVNGTNTITIVDISTKGQPELISEVGYENSQYSHQGWLTEDHRYFLSNDELDELRLNRKTRTLIWDVQDLDNPELIGHFEHGTNAIDHNLYTKGDFVFEANYANGLRILDLSDIGNANLREAAYFDTFRSSDVTDFVGAWSNYPYLPSGNIIISDISNGLFVVRRQSFYVAEQPADLTECEGAHINIPVNVEGQNLSYQWQVNDGTGFADITDFERYKNTTTSTMHAHTLNNSQNGYQYRCVITNGDSEIISDAMTLSVRDTAEAAFSFDPVDIAGLVAFSNGSVNADSYLWKFGDGNTSAEASPSYRFAADGSYVVTLIASNECSADTLEQTIDLIVASFNELDSQLEVYPTVTDGSITIHNKMSEEFSIEIFSLDGTKVLEKENLRDRVDLSIRDYKHGLYLLKVTSGNETTIRKIVIN